MASCIIEGVYLGGKYDTDFYFLAENNIKTIINVAEEINGTHDPEIEYYKIPITDSMEERISAWEQCYKIIDSNLSAKKKCFSTLLLRSK